jgi:hypothetical protein
VARLSQDTKHTDQYAGSNFTYRYDSRAGKGVDIYVLGELHVRSAENSNLPAHQMQIPVTSFAIALCRTC